MNEPVRFLIVGAGSRGAIHAQAIAALGGRARVVGVAEPREDRRRWFAEEHGLARDRCFADWALPLRGPRFADAVVIATPDRLHLAPTLAFAEAGFHVLLEKPMAPSVDGCRRIVETVERQGVLFAVCHVLRYAPYTLELKALIDSGAIGHPVSVQHLEPVGYWHQAHSFVRGNWRNEAGSGCMLLAKCCHDVDWLSHVMGALPARVSSFGSLTHFRPERAPSGATERCGDCPVEPECPYSAGRIYGRLYREGCRGWPLDVLTLDVSPEGIEEALRQGPYGRCVYRCDNDVVDHQVVNLEFDSGTTGSFTMTAFTRPGVQRQTTVFGTAGELRCDGRRLEVYDFLSERVRVREVSAGTDEPSHAGGDQAMVSDFVEAVARNDPSRLVSGAAETLATHLAVFAAEHARRTGQVIEVAGFAEPGARSPSRPRRGTAPRSRSSCASSDPGSSRGSPSTPGGDPAWRPRT